VAAIFVGSSSSGNKKKYKMSRVSILLLLVLGGAWLEVNSAAASSSSCSAFSDLDEAVTAYVKALFGNSVVGGECSILVKKRRR
jgi:hypothetical protein